VTEPVELIIVERSGMRLGVPAGRVAEVAALPWADTLLQQRLGQPPLEDDERCFALRVVRTDAPGGEDVVTVAGRVSITAVPAHEIAPLPELMAGVAPVAAVVFSGDNPVLVLDVDAMVAHARADR
jgi:chemotaxis signal transduction protein